MALITCPECGNTISDKAPLCPHCGILKEDIQAMLHIEIPHEIKCLFCGSTIERCSSNCPKCNYPVLRFSNDTKLVEKTLSQNNNSALSAEESLAGFIADDESSKLSLGVMNLGGKKGPVVIRKVKDEEFSIRLTNAMILDRGLIYEDRTDTQKCEVVMNSPDVLIIDRKITKTAEIFDLLEGIRNQGSGMLIIADDISGQALNSIEHYRERWNLELAAVRAPGYGDRRKAIMRDIAIATGGEIITSEYKDAITYRKALDKMGHAEYIKVSQDETLIVGGYGQQSDINERIVEIKEKYHSSYSEFDKAKMQERIDNLVLKGAVVNIGAYSIFAQADIAKRIEEALDEE